MDWDWDWGWDWVRGLSAITLGVISPYVAVL